MNMRKIISVLVSVLMLCSIVPMGVFADSASPVWGTENLVEGQQDITINNYDKHYLDVTLDKDTGYRLDYTITFNTSVAGHWNNVSNMLRESASDLISFGIWNDAGDGSGQLRFAENDISNAAQTAVMGTGGLIPAGVAFPISIVIMPDYVELYISGQLQTLYLTAGGTATRIPVSKRIEDGKIGFIGQGSHPDATISNIALYSDADSAEQPTAPVWDTENLVAGQQDITLNNYDKHYLDATLNKDTGYRLDYTITFNTSVAGKWNFVSNMLRESASDLISFGIWNDAGSGEGQLRFAENDISNNAHIAVIGTGGLIPAGVAFPISVVIMPDYVELYISGQIQTMFLASGATATRIPVSKRIENGQIGFIAQGSNPDATISNIALYADLNTKVEEPEEVWTEIATKTSVTVDGSNPYIYQWVTDELDKESTYRIEYTLTYTDKIGDSNFASTAVRGIPGAEAWEATGLFMAHDSWQKVRFGDTYDTNGALYSTSGTANATATPVKYTIISAPDSVTVYMDDVLMKQYDFTNYVDGKKSVPVPSIDGGRVGFRGFGANPNFTVTDISVKVKGVPHVCADSVEYTAAKAATCYEEGNVEYWYCANCDVYYADADCTVITNAENVILPVSHNVKHVEAVAPTCFENGNIEYWYCEDCGQAWLDELCHLNTNLKAVILPMAHGELTHVEAKEPTCTELGNIEYWYCEACGYAWLDAEGTLNTNLKAVVLPMVDHEYFYPCDTFCMNCFEETRPEATHSIIAVDAKEATCTEMGNIAYWYCSDCGQAWLDADCTMNTNMMAVKLPMVDHEYMYPCDGWCMNCYEFTNPDAAHSMTHVAAKDATCTENGNIEYWTCEYCGGCWDNENGIGMPLNRMMVTILAQHSYDDDFDTQCNVCDEIRVVDYPVITFSGNSISEDVNGLAFRFNVNADYATLNLYEGSKYLVDYNNCYVTPDSTGTYKLVHMGAVISNNWGITHLDHVDGKNVIDVSALKIVDIDSNPYYTIRILNIPEANRDTYITARPYMIYEDESGNRTVVYGEEQMATYNGVLNG